MQTQDDLRGCLGYHSLHGSGNYNTIVVSPPSVDITNSVNSSVLCQDYVISESLLGEQRTSDGRMSNVRRFFCLFVTFDLLFTSLMWLICIMLSGDSIWVALSKEVANYNVHSSLFDIVLVAICRFLALVLFYGMCQIKHWIVISWANSSQPVFQVLLILASFVLSWVEVWFLDTRVIPQETQRRVIFSTPDNEQAPLLRRFVQNIQGLASEQTESVANYHSVQGSPSPSVDRFGEQPGRFPTISLSPEQLQKYKVISIRAYKEARYYLQSSNWKQFKTQQEDKAFITTTDSGVKIYKLSCIINVAADFLFEELYHNVERMVEWNKTLLESHKVQAIEQHMDVTYQVTKSAGSGMISSRDFVILRRWAQHKNHYCIASVSVDFPSVPGNDKYIRGENGPGCHFIATHTAESCKLEWVLNTDLKGKIPVWILDNAITGSMFEYVNCLRDHLNRQTR